MTLNSNHRIFSSNLLSYTSRTHDNGVVHFFVARLSFVCGLNISKRIMSVFPGFGGWINQNIQQRPEAESGRSENVKSSPVSEKDTNLKPWYDEPDYSYGTWGCKV
ncbi:unnamed protein product [Arabidopsis thaliana]|uniref:Uncharacterized protein n=1 Tax=Arabidopsis thaliana TaxID=3702 RepID=A0A654EDH3_ARATH|nr:unnamed protein product [Arabidopsis thaliana]